MKKIVILFLAASVYAQSPQPIPEVTGIQVVNILDDAVVLEWFSDIAEATPGDFLFYYNATNAVASAKMRDDSRIVHPRNFRFSPRAGRYLYTAEIPLNISGEFYFAVAPNRSPAVDEAVRQNLPLSAPFSLQPEQSYTIQPVAFRLRRVARTAGAVSNLGAPSQLLVKSLRLSSEEDIFRLTWMVSQSNLSRYVFRIYRSRYPLVGLIDGQTVRSLESLPVYAVVENKFSFEDRNISFETPYYYAVVAEGSTQWNSGLNVFSTPAVLVRQSPPFAMTPQQEAVRQTRPFAVQQSSQMEETDIERAVQQTLSNLMYAPLYTNIEPMPQIALPNVEPIAPQDLLDAPGQGLPSPNAPAQETLYRGSMGREVEADDPALLELFYRGLAARYNALMQTETGLTETLAGEAKKEEAQFLADVRTLKQDMFAYTGAAGRLAQSARLGEAQFRPLAVDFLKRRDQILLKEFTLKNTLRSIQNRNALRKESLLGQLNAAQKQYLQSVETLKGQHKKALEALVQKLQKEQEARVAEVNRRIEAQNREREIAGRSEALTRRVQNPSTNGLQEAVESAPYNQSLPLVSLEPISAPVLSKLDSPSFYALPQMISPEVRLQSMPEPVINEPIPSLAELEKLSGKKEEWLAAKVNWLTNNAQNWKENIDAWKEKVPSLFDRTETYERMGNTWDIPSMPISPQTAYAKGKEAFDQAKYDEAAFFLVRVPENDSALMMLGQSFYRKGLYKEAVSVFASAYQMKIPESLPWLLEASQKYTAQPK